MIPNNIKRLRLRAKLSQTALAARLGISRQSVQQWESGIALPSIENIITLSILFRCTTDEILKGLPELAKIKILLIENGYEQKGGGYCKRLTEAETLCFFAHDPEVLIAVSKGEYTKTVEVTVTPSKKEVTYQADENDLSHQGVYMALLDTLKYDNN